jgi:hypothetical protein
MSGQLHAPAVLPPVYIGQEAVWAPWPVSTVTRDIWQRSGRTSEFALRNKGFCDFGAVLIRIHKLYSPPSIIRMIKSRCMRCAGHVARMVRRRMQIELWWEQPVWRPRHRCEYKPESRGFNSRWGHCIYFNLPNPSSRAMALGSTQHLTETSTRNFSWEEIAAGA